MPWDGSGTFSRSDGSRSGASLWQQSDQAGIAPNPQDFDRVGADMARGISNCVARDGQNTPTKDLPMGGRKHTGVGDAAKTDQYAAYGQLLALTFPFVAAGDVAGSANAVVLSVTPSPGAYTAGRGYRWFAKSANNGAMTVAEGSKAAVGMRRANNTAFEGGEIKAGALVTAVYDGTRFVTNVVPPPAEVAGFDLHEDVTTELTSPAGTDRLVASDESTSGDPNRWLSLTRLATWVKGQISEIARIPSASPGNNKVWKSNNSGTPGWRDEQTLPDVPIQRGVADSDGTANALMVTAQGSLSAGRGWEFFALATNTGAVTIQIGSNTVKNAVRADGQAFEGGEIQAGTPIIAIYDGTRFRTNVQLRQWFGTQTAYDNLSAKRNGVIYHTR